MERNGTAHKVWGYGIDSIIEPDYPIDPSSRRKLFPHVPSELFVKLEKRRIDLLIGLNFNGLFPVGGSGRDCRENLKVMKTKFGSTGWILGGSHRSLCYSKPQLSSGAVEILTAAKVHCIPDVGVRILDHDKIKEKVTVMKVALEPMLTPEYWLLRWQVSGEILVK